MLYFLRKSEVSSLKHFVHQNLILQGKKYFFLLDFNNPFDIISFIILLKKFHYYVTRKFFTSERQHTSLIHKMFLKHIIVRLFLQLVSNFNFECKYTFRLYCVLKNYFYCSLFFFKICSIFFKVFYMSTHHLEKE